MIDHTGISSSQLGRSKEFYNGALKPLGLALKLEFPASVTGSTDVAGFGAPDHPGGPEFWLAEAPPGKPVHIAFRAESRAAVDAFYDAALAAGGTCNGKPGIRAHYHEHYYGAFVLDPDGHNIEAVCHNKA